MIRPGNLIHKLIFQTRTETSDGLGAGGTSTWANTLTRMAERWSVKGSERVEAARNKLNNIYRWHLRYDSLITPAMRIKWTDRIGAVHYQEILAINLLDNLGTEIEILAEEKI